MYEMDSQLSFLAEPEKKNDHKPRPGPSRLDWLLHAAGCTACTAARCALLELREHGWDPARHVPLACPTGLELITLDDLELLAGPQGLTREQQTDTLIEMRKYADRLRGATYENMHMGVAWYGGPLPGPATPPARRSRTRSGAAAPAARTLGGGSRRAVATRGSRRPGRSPATRATPPASGGGPGRAAPASRQAAGLRP